MAIIRPRLNDYHKLLFTQDEVNFAIPFIDEDIPLYLDPFLLWKSPSQQDNALHSSIITSFNQLGNSYKVDPEKAVENLIELSECDEIGLGNSKSKTGKKIGKKLATEVLETFKNIPQVRDHGYDHIEELQFLVEKFSKDRISDIASNLMKSFLIDFTIQKSDQYNIPKQAVIIRVFDHKTLEFINEEVTLPVNPETSKPIIFVPKHWLRFNPWLNIDEYFTNYVTLSEKIAKGEKISRLEVLEFNRKNFDAVQTYVATKQNDAGACKNDPLFTQIPVLSTARKLKTILGLPTGKTENADKEFERNIAPILATVLYPELDFATDQVRSVSGVHIRDMIFYNNTSHDFPKLIYDTYSSRQVIFEFKNVEEVTKEHVDQLNRYMKDDFGKFGIIFTRNAPSKKVFNNTIDLWSGQRRCILILTDEDLKFMCEIYKNKQRRPIDVIAMRYSEFMNACPS